jgi:hypothetical protein
LASAVTRTGEYFAAYLDDKPATTPRVTNFIFSGAAADGDVPPRSPGLGPAPEHDGHEVLNQYEGVHREAGDER